MLADNLVGRANEDDLFDFRQLMAQANNKLGGIGSNSFVLRRRNAQSQRAVHVRALADESDIAPIPESLRVIDRHSGDSFVDVSEEDLVLRESLFACVHVQKRSADPTPPPQRSTLTRRVRRSTLRAGAVRRRPATAGPHVPSPDACRGAQSEMCGS